MYIQCKQVMERQMGIKDVEKQVADVSEIFRDLAVMVSEQGHMLDDIEEGLVGATDQAQAGTDELKKAVANQKKARRTLCCLVVVLLLVGSLVVLIVTKTI